jgi:hypothetical protein
MIACALFVPAGCSSESSPATAQASEAGSAGGKGAGGGSSAQTGVDTTVVDTLRAIADNVNPDIYLYANHARAERAYDAALASPAPAQRAHFMLLSAAELVRAGESEQALERLEQVRTILRSARITPDERMRGSILHLEAVASLRLGEQDNCLLNHTADSCIMPIASTGVHQNERGSRAAIAALDQLLTMQPRSAQYTWLLNLAHMTLGQYPDGVPKKFRIPPATFESEAEMPRLDDVAAAAGVDVRELSGGVIMEDFDNDGRFDLIMSSWGLRDQLKYFRNTGEGTFEDRTESAGLIGQWGGLNLSHADYDNDGDFDVLVLRGGWLFDAGEHPNSLLRNNGDGTFTDVTVAAGMFSLKPSQTAAWGDFDNDGLLDVFIGCEPTSKTRHASELFRNNGDGTFTEISRRAGVIVTGVVKAVTCGDFDNDDRLDLYISRFGEPNQLFRNAGPGADGNVRFVDVTASAGVAEPRNSFPTWFFDYDNDGWLDLLVAGFAGFDGDSLDDVAADYVGIANNGTPCHLYRNRGDGTFEDVSATVGIDRVILAMGANFGDVDNDGWLDCAFGTGEPTLSTLVPNRLFRNDGGTRFLDVTTAAGFGNVQKGHGIAFGDLDADGDQDIAVTLGGAYVGDIYPNLLLRNPGHGNHWLTVRCVGGTSNRSAVGARIAVTVRTPNGTRTIHRVVSTGGSFGSSTVQQEIGLGDAISIESLRIHWPTSGTSTTIDGVPLDAIVRVHEDQESFERITPVAAPLPGGAPVHEHVHTAHDHTSTQ